MPAGHPISDHARHRSLWRALAILGLCAAAALLLSLDPVYEGLQRLLVDAEPVIAAHPLLGALLFVLLAAVSAVLAFFSSALLVPAAIYAWGPWVTGALLWIGWWLGGLFAYTVGSMLRGSGAAAVPPRIAAYLPASSQALHFPLVLLWQLVLPSEIPGYVCGWLGVPRRTYLAAVAVAELPYAVGAVLLGESVVERRTGWLLVLGVLAALLAYGLVRAAHRRQAR